VGELDIIGIAVFHHNTHSCQSYLQLLFDQTMDFDFQTLATHISTIVLVLL
jgi:hypothetical protein